MSAHMSLSVSVAVVGAIATYVSVGLIPEYYSVWIGFVRHNFGRVTECEQGWIIPFVNKSTVPFSY